MSTVSKRKFFVSGISFNQIDENIKYIVYGYIRFYKHYDIKYLYMDIIIQIFAFYVNTCNKETFDLYCNSSSVTGNKSLLSVLISND